MGSEVTMKIPNTIHFIWVGSPVPDWASAIIQMWRKMNPDFEIKVHRHGSQLLLPKYEKFYSHMRMTCNKVDVQKWGLLQQEGGWVMDTDTVPLRPFREYLKTVPASADFVGVEYSKARDALDMGWIGACTDSAIWPIIDEFLVDLKGVNFKRPNQGGHSAINYVYKKAPHLFHVEKREIYCPYSRHDYKMRALGLKFYHALMQDEDVTPYVEEYYEYCKFPAYGWHLWANGRSTLG